jgi:transposase
MDGNQLKFPWGPEAPTSVVSTEEQHAAVTRRQRGYEIFLAKGVKKIYRRNEWRVASQSTEGAFYTVRVVLGRTVCNCPDFSDLQAPCKHIFATRFTSNPKEQDNPPDLPGNILPLRRDWKTYNQMKPWVESCVAHLLLNLARVLDDPPPRRGNQPAPLADLIFASVMRVYVDESARDFCGDVVKKWVDAGYISQLYHFNTLTSFMRRKVVTHILTEFIRETARPLAQLDSPRVIAIDSTGFTMAQSSTWYDVKYGRTTKREYRKLHIAVDALTHVVTDAIVSNSNGDDTTRLPTLLKGTMTRITPSDVVADKAYAGKPNYDAIQSAGATPFIPPRGRMTGKGSELMRQMFHAFRTEDPVILQRYHQRSNVETVMFMLKTQFGERLATRSQTGQVNELLAKVLCHNLHSLVMASARFGLSLKFFPNAEKPNVA